MAAAIPAIPERLLRFSTDSNFSYIQWKNFSLEELKTIAELLATNPHFESLSLAGSRDLGSQCISAILEAARRNNTHLKSLDLMSCDLGPGDAKTIAELLAANTPLGSLSLGWNRSLGSQGISAILEAAKRNSHLKSLDLEFCDLSPGDAKAIAELLATNTLLESLSLTGNRDLGLQGISAILEAARRNNTHLRSLKLRCCYLGPGDAKTIAELLEADTRLESLSLSLNPGVLAAGFNIILEAARTNSHLKSLDLDSCDLGPGDAKAIAELLAANTPLGSLSLGRNRSLGSQGISAILEAAQRNSHLKSLDLEFCDLGPGDAKAIAELLEADTPLRSLSLGRNILGREGFNLILEAAKRNTHLRSLDLRECNLGPDNLKSLIELLQVNTNITYISGIYDPEISELLTRNERITKETERERMIVNNIEIVLEEWGWGGDRVTKPLDIIQLFFSPEEIDVYEKYLAQKSMRAIREEDKKDLKEIGERGGFKSGAEEIKAKEESEAAKKSVNPPTSLLNNRANLMKEIRSGMQRHRSILEHLSQISKESGEVISKIDFSLQELGKVIESVRNIKGDVETQTVLAEFDSLRARLTRGSGYHQELTASLLRNVSDSIPRICEGNIRRALDQAQDDHQKAKALVQEALKPLIKEEANYEELLVYLKQYLEEAQHLKSRTEAIARNRVNLMQEISNGMQRHRSVLEHLSQISKESGEVISKIDFSLQELGKVIESVRNIKGDVETQTVLAEFERLRAKLTRGSGYHQELTTNLLGNASDSISRICEVNIQQVSHQAQNNPLKAQELVQEALKPLKQEEANYEELSGCLKQYLQEAQYLKLRVEAMVAKAVASTTPMQGLAKNSPNGHVDEPFLHTNLKKP